MERERMPKGGGGGILCGGGRVLTRGGKPEGGLGTPA